MRRILTRAGLITPDPAERPRASWRSFSAALPNQLWQADFTHWSLADRTDVEILTYLDDHSRYAIACTAHRVTTVRPHRSLDRATPATAYRALPMATPTGAPTGWRIRTDRVDKNGRVAVRLHSRLHHIGIGRAYARTPGHTRTPRTGGPGCFRCPETSQCGDGGI